MCMKKPRWLAEVKEGINNAETTRLMDSSLVRLP